MKIHSFIIISNLSILFFSCTIEQQGCEIGFTEIELICYNENDLEVLQAFIDNSSETIPMEWDTNANGSIEHLELGVQEWDENGRLTLLWIYDYTINNDYKMSVTIPENIGNLTQLKKMNLGINQITGEIPESIGKLENLEFLYLYHNQLSGIIPNSICNIFPNLSNFWIQYNYFCPPYPDCIPKYEINPQNTSQCPE